MLHWLEHVFGLDSANGDYYLFWSGFGADLAMFAAVIGFLRRHNCHELGCWRLAHHPKDRCRRHLKDSNGGSTGPA